jgi:hypothetical protein
MSFTLFMQIVALIVISFVVYVVPLIVFAEPMLRWITKKQVAIMTEALDDDEDFDEHIEGVPGLRNIPQN